MGIVKKLVLGRVMLLLFLGLANYSCNKQEDNTLTVDKNSHIVLVGNNLGSRMMNFGHFETEMQLRYPADSLYIRNMCDGANTPGFRPHAARESPWAFLGADKYEHESGEAIHFVEDDGNHQSGPVGHFPTPDEWITSLKADIIIAFFGYSESFEGPEGLANYKEELRAFIKHTLSQKYNGVTAPQLALVSPIAYEDLSEKMDLPDGKKENKNLALYTEAMKEVAADEGVLIVDAFEPTKEWFETENEDLTQDGFQLTDFGYQKFAGLLADQIFGKTETKAETNRQLVHKAVNEKNWFW